MALILLLGVVLRAVQYGAGSSLAIDEAALARNIVERGWGALLAHPLDHFQVAPIGFLALEKASVSVAGGTEAALRLFPFLFSIASLLLFWLIARRYLRYPSMLVALILFAVSPAAVLYAGMAKQYSGDVASTLFLVWAALHVLENARSLKESAILGAVGGVATLTSHPAVLVALGTGVPLLVWGRRAGRPMSPVLVVCAGWFAGAAILTGMSLATLSASTGDYMRQFWSGSFVPRPWLGVEELLWLPSQLGRSLTWFTVGPQSSAGPLPAIVVSGLFAGLLLPGLWYLFRKRAKAAFLLAVPAIMAIGAALVHLLPLGGRVSLYLHPFLLIGCIAGVEQLREWMSNRLGGLLYGGSLGVLTLLGLVGLARMPPPQVLGATRPVLNAVKARWAPGDRLVAFKGPKGWTYNTVQYYGRRLGLVDWNQIDYRMQGEETSEEILRGYLRRIDDFRGAPRVWFHLEGTKACEEEAVLGYLSAIGKRRYSIEARIDRAPRTSAQLFDLSDPERLAGARADSFPVPECGVIRFIQE